MNDFGNIPFSSESFEDIPFSNNTQNSFEDIPFDNNIVPATTDNNILILDERIKDIPAKNTKVSFKRTSIIFPIVAFVFVSILGMYLFVNNSKADTLNLIRIEENSKVGYIDNEGTIIARPKYTFGTDFYKGYAIVKNNNNLYGVLDGKGVVEVPFGTFYYIGLYGNRYITSKITNNGLKQALLDPKLEELTSYKYDSISYSTDGMYLFTRDETMGILNEEGKEIYSFKVDEVDDRNIDIEISEVDEDLPLSDRYAKVKVNNSSTIINLDTGKEVYSYTLKDINVLDNNVFYIKSDNLDENSTYIVIKDSDVKYKTSKYKRIRVDDYDSNIAIAINDDSTISYINLSNQKIMNENNNSDYYYGDGLLLEKTHDFNSTNDVYSIVSSKKIEGTFKNYVPVNNTFYNKMLNVMVNPGKYNYVDFHGKIINNKSYDETSDFNKYGYAIVAVDKNYGILNSNGKEVVRLSNMSLDFIDNDLFGLLKKEYKKGLFLYSPDNSKYGFINDRNKIEMDANYEEVKYITSEYPVVLVKKNGENLLVNLASLKELPIEVNTDDIVVKNNYISINGNYYNYLGKLIYSVR